MKQGPVRGFEELRDSGMLWLINRVAFHPRGFALGLVYDDGDDSKPIGWSIMHDGSEIWRFTDSDDEDGFRRAEETLRQGRGETKGEV